MLDGAEGELAALASQPAARAALPHAPAAIR
jgi:hypothetical protein